MGDLKVTEIGPEEARWILEWVHQLMQWTIALFGATAFLILKGDAPRPANRVSRYSYLLLIPAWLCLLMALLLGVEISASYRLYLSRMRDFEYFSAAVVRMVDYQEYALAVAIIFVAVWLSVQIAFWVFSAANRSERAKSISD